MSETRTTDLVRSLLDAYAASDRDAAERLIAADFHFTSPLDNRLDRASYFSICWPNSKIIEGYDIEHMLTAEDKVAVTYVGRFRSGKRVRNTEVMTCRDGRIVAVEVYFGWSVPHEVSPGTHADPA